MDVASFDFERAGLLVLRLVVNGKRREKKIKVKSGLMSRLAAGDYRYLDVDKEVRRLLFLQISLMVGEILLEDTENFNKIMERMVMSRTLSFDYNTLVDVSE